MAGPFLATPFVFDDIMRWLGEIIDGIPYQYTYTSVPTDAASYAANVTWMDAKTQPTWAYITTGGGWMTYNENYQDDIALYRVDMEPVLDSIAGTIPASQVQSDWTASSGLGVILHKPTLATVATSGSYNDLSSRPALAMVATSGSYTDLSGRPAARSQSAATRSLNSSFQISTTRDCLANYSISIVATLSLTTGQSGTASFQISADNITFVEAARITNGNTGTLAVGLSLAQTSVQALTVYVPAGYYTKLVTSGTATTTYIAGQETLL